MIRVVLPYHLRTLAGLGEAEVAVAAGEAATLAEVLAALEGSYPALRGTIREHGTGRRRPFVRFYACREDLSHEPPETTVLPPAVQRGEEPLLVVGAMSGG